MARRSKPKVYDNAKDDTKKIKCPPKVPSASTSRGLRHPLCVSKLHKYHQISSLQRKAVCVVLSGMKVPGGYFSNTCVNSDKIVGLKSHDYHILMQQLLPVAIRNVGLSK